MDALTLFDAPASQGAARKTDPATSVEAARSVDHQRQRDQILRLLASNALGLTADELASRMRPSPHRSAVASRLAQLAKERRVEAFGRRLAPSGRYAMIWFYRRPRTVEVVTGSYL